MANRVLTIIALVACCGGAPARAAETTNEFLAHVVGGLRRDGASFACFSRQYDGAHLAAHPRQRVTFAKALVDAYRRGPSLGTEEGGFEYQVTFAFRFRGRTETLTQVAECGGGKPKDSLSGGATCAGPGEGPSHLAIDGKDTLVLTIPGGADLWMPGPIDKRHDVVKNPFGPDDVAFRLTRTNVRDCEDLAFDRQKPLRAHEP